MNVKPLDLPVLLLQTEALARRLQPQHMLQDVVKKQATMLRTGYKGEESLDFPLRFLPKNQYYIFHNLRIRDESGFFQIDKLILTNKFILIIEVKNIYGILKYDAMDQLIRITADKEEGFSNPIAQVQLQSLRLRRWLRTLHFPPIPVETLVVHTDSRSIIKNVSNRDVINRTVIHKENLLSKIESISDVYTAPCLTDIQLNELSDWLVFSHRPYIVDILQKYQITKDDLLLGVICPACSAMPMSRNHGNWRCFACDHRDKNAHISALKDYNLLISNVMNNRQATSFLQLDSEHVARRILSKEHFQKVGSTSGRKYILNYFPLNEG